MNTHTKIGLGTAAIGRPQYINIKQEAQKPFDLAEFKQQGLAMLITQVSDTLIQPQVTDWQSSY